MKVCDDEAEKFLEKSNSAASAIPFILRESMQAQNNYPVAAVPSEANRAFQSRSEELKPYPAVAISAAISISPVAIPIVISVVAPVTAVVIVVPTMMPMSVISTHSCSAKYVKGQHFEACEVVR